jgi:hypothetical protein
MESAGNRDLRRAKAGALVRGLGMSGFEEFDDHFHDHCGVVGVYGHEEAAKLVYLGLYALQHRGQE